MNALRPKDGLADIVHSAAFSPIRRSENHFQTELHLTRAVRLGRDFAEVRSAVHVGVRRRKADPVQRVERLGPELHADFFRDLELLEEREVEIIREVVPQVRDQRLALPSV